MLYSFLTRLDPENSLSSPPHKQQQHQYQQQQQQNYQQHTQQNQQHQYRDHKLSREEGGTGDNSARDAYYSVRAVEGQLRENAAIVRSGVEITRENEILKMAAESRNFTLSPVGRRLWSLLR